MSRVAIVGTGPSGLSQLRAFSEAQRKGADTLQVKSSILVKQTD